MRDTRPAPRPRGGRRGGPLRAGIAGPVAVGGLCSFLPARRILVLFLAPDGRRVPCQTGLGPPSENYT